MDRPSDAQKPRDPKPGRKLLEGGTKTLYLILYNQLSSLFWGVVLFVTLSTAFTSSPKGVYSKIGTFTKWTQTLAALEILHSLLRVVRAPLFTTVMQVASRFLLVWGIVHPSPELATDENSYGAYAYTSMLLAWSLTEVVRYQFFTVSLVVGGAEKVPGYLRWLRYNLFYVLYPLGISSECHLVWLASQGQAKYMEIGGVPVRWGLYAILAVYVPGSYILFTHMMAQRRKVMRAEGQKKVR